MREKRRKIWIDRFQTKLFLRIAFYFTVYQVAVWALVIIDTRLAAAREAVFGPEGGGLFGYMTVAVIFLGVLFTYDAIKFCHRIVGPIYRFRKTIQAITEGEAVDLVRLREGDFLQDMRDDLNEMLKVLEERGAVVLKEEGVCKETVS